MDKVLITVRYSLFVKPKSVWRNVYTDKKGMFVTIDREKRYLADMKKENDLQYHLYISLYN
ncbi:hypothetical protein KAMFAM_241 [Bacillus phage Kamfam]|nr:hypothetical protein OTK52_239 [Bacillus phage OTooleKemple52]AXQ67079.1 hypothetical protein KAMFAM_241 [Bacillus phage Kamfam]